MTFKIGDTVQIIAVQSGEDWRGETGTVVKIVDKKVGVQFHTYNGKRHSLDGLCPHGYGWWYFNEQLQRLAPTAMGIEDLI